MTTEAQATRICVLDSCRQEFVPKRSTQVFHDPECRKAFWHLHQHGAVHKCPLCSAMHDPEEGAVLDALEMLVATVGDYRNLSAEVQAFIARRRAIMEP